MRIFSVLLLLILGPKVYFTREDKNCKILDSWLKNPWAYLLLNSCYKYFVFYILNILGFLASPHSWWACLLIIFYVANYLFFSNKVLHFKFLCCFLIWVLALKILHLIILSLTSRISNMHIYIYIYILHNGNFLD